jgi:ABC-type transport system involved in multi-copper enzyme maturation permease subunit
MKLRAIALNTFKEAVRNKVFYLLIFVGIFFALSSQIISMLTIGSREKVLKDAGLAAISFFTVLIAIFSGINLIFKEIDKKTIFNILSKPISRSKFIIGKFLGLALTLLVALLAMSSIFMIFLTISTGSFELKLYIYYGLLYIELLILTAVSLLFTSVSTPILSSIFTIIVYLVGHVLWTFNQFKGLIKSEVIKAILVFLYYVMPNLEKFNIKSEIVTNTPLDPTLILHSVLYGIFYISAILVLTILVFKRKEF